MLKPSYLHFYVHFYCPLILLNTEQCYKIVLFKYKLKIHIKRKIQKFWSKFRNFDLGIQKFQNLRLATLVYGHPGSSTVVGGGNKNKNKIENSKRQPPYYGGKNMMYYKCTISSWYFVKFCVLFYIFKIFHFYYWLFYEFWEFIKNIFSIH